MKKTMICLLTVVLLLFSMPLSVAEGTYAHGNVDGEGDITANDALLALQASTGKVDLTAEQLVAANVDGEDGTTANDALLILQYATQKIASFPDMGGTGEGLKGAEIVIAAMESSCFSLDDTDNQWNKRIAEELGAIEKELNCTFKINIYDSISLTQQCIEADASGKKFADIMVTTVWQQRPLVKAKALTDLNTVNGLDLSKSYWDQTAYRDMQLYGKNFMGMTTLDGTAANANVIYFNKVLAKSALEKLGQKAATPEDAGNILYDMVEKGTWTFDQMQMLSQKAKADLTGDGKMDDKTAMDQYGFAGEDIRGSVSYSIFKSKGGFFTKKNLYGDVVYALDDAINITALKTMQTWLLKDDSVYNSDKYGNSHTISRDAFKDGHVLFLGGSSGIANEFADMKQDWGILPYPKADTRSDYIGAFNWNAQGFSIPCTTTGTDLKNTAVALNAIAQRFQTLREEKDAYMAENVYRDAQTAQVMQFVESIVSVDFVQFGDLGSGGLASIHYLFDKVSNDPAQRVKSVREDAVTALNEFLAAVK